MKSKLTGHIMFAVGAGLLLALSCNNPIENPFQKPFKIDYKTTDKVFSVGDTIAIDTPVVEGIAPIVFSISPHPPLGLQLDANNGSIYGVPREVSARTEYSVTATNSHGSMTIKIFITVLTAAPQDLVYDNDSAVYKINVPIFSNRPSFKGGAPTGYSCSPQLPTGLSIDANNGSIYGTPTALSTKTRYQIIGSNSGGSDTAFVFIQVDTAVTVDTIVPRPLFLNAVRVDSLRVKLTWRSVSGADYYLVFSDQTGQFLQIKTTVDTLVVDSTRFNNQYYVKAHRGAYLSKSSDIVSTLDTVSTHPINNPPRIISSLANRSIPANQIDTIKIVIAHADAGQTVTIKIVNIDSLKALFGVDSAAAVKWQPATDTNRIIFSPKTRSGSYTFNIRVSDGVDSINASVTEYVGNVNHPPQWNDSSIAVSVNDSNRYMLVLKDFCSDPDAGTRISYRFISDSAKCLLINDSLFVFDAGLLDSTIHIVRIEASDGALTDTLKIAINILPVYYTLTTSAQNGSVTLAPAGPTFRMGRQAVCTGVPAQGYEFAGWSDGVTSTDNPVTITMNANTSITANFRRINESDFIYLMPGASINDKIKEFSALSGGSTLAPNAGKYDANTIEVEGKVTIQIKGPN